MVAAAQQSAQPNCPVHLLQFWSERAILIATNAMVDEVNQQVLGELQQDTLVTYHSIDEVDASTPDEQALWPIDFLN